ncbi:hypothetical protein A3A46_02370 [Candidatus Roizmanbacteria bacterium RIFCSPLOWO2_01_FULL_37_13]|uniref:Uncharacterized protein n=1 Tax=Candidatus Roizmanbacteria bacterium RIFCSPHIGHO2_02_FULL_38_11 TaxID=1802039 RepID=A0A1F7H377_9BACT|nr:MAG: hypothetical protein A3C25_03770 [Candidatus Roizmanbacteria bacterium RIFCSPHIGHO2_02_FULL_38_11]OGK34160.1 MAG: hypothetical protein A3F58_03645 [Candidatus Roizmanbacteria bacterium RIFCSPHIGHO2_12_FULL_37_9b]OGK41423.1 MAG: hypothetical protein A3A46_02370 [Candidatus Roizmanbacteria bacterium RIFCSPLOWO2_01_FULL_37_13]
MGKPGTIIDITDASHRDHVGEKYVIIHTHTYEASLLHNLLLGESRPDEIIIPANLLTPPIGLVVISATIEARTFFDHPEAEGKSRYAFGFYARIK